MADLLLASPDLPAAAPPPRSRRGGAFFRELRRSGTALFGLIIIVVIVGSALFAPLIAPHDPTMQSLTDRLQPPLLFGGTAEHPLGTDQLGRDLLSRLLYGARVSLGIAASVVAIAGCIGIGLGLVAGYFGKWIDTVIMRAADMQLAFPGILLDVVILYALGPSAKLLIIVLALNGWMIYARITRSLVLPLRHAEYIEAAEIAGARPLRVMGRHILPNLASPLMTLIVLEFARIILAEAALSFLGYGIQPPNSSWGLIVAQGQDYLDTAWWLVTLPGAIICITVLSTNLFASWLRIYTDPRQREKQLSRQLDALMVSKP
ncbi:MAG: transporter permease [Frankiales bacterium]|nr:transporter permease [Frankiales bacterium]